MLAESLNRLPSRTLTPTNRYVLFHIAPMVTVMLGVPMVVLLTVWAKFQPASFRLPSIVGAVATLLASTCPATATAVPKAPYGINKPIITSRQSRDCHFLECLNVGNITVSPFFSDFQMN